MGKLNDLLQQQGSEVATPETPTSTEQPSQSCTSGIPQVNVPDIRTSAVLATLTITEWSGVKKDRKASDDVTMRHGAVSNAAKVNKELLPNFRELKDIHNFVAAARKRHIQLTMPWGERGQRLLPTAMLPEYKAWATETEELFHELRTAVGSKYEWEVRKVSAAGSELGTLYDANDYDSRAVVEGKFSITFDYNPIPAADDFRVDVGKDALQELQASCDAAYARVIEDTTADLWKRLHEPLQNMVAQLQEANFDGSIRGFKKNGEPKEAGFKETLVPNVMHIVRMMEVANWSDNPVMDDAIRKLKSDLTGITSGMLKSNTLAREKVRATAENVLQSIPSLNI